MRILLLGANGMLGHALREALRGDDVVPWTRTDLNFDDYHAIRSRVPEAKPDIVVNVVAYTDVERAEEESERAETVNGCAPGVLAKTCAHMDVPLLHVSTDYVFGDEGGEYDEDDRPAAPLNCYGASKLLGEELIREHAEKFWIVRTAWLFGPHGKNFISTMLRLGAERDHVRVVGDQEGCPTYTPDLAGGIRDLMHDAAPYGVYHLTNSGVTTWADFAREAFEIAGLSVEVEPISSEEYSKEFGTRARRPIRSVLWNTKRPSLRPWQAALRDFVPDAIRV